MMTAVMIASIAEFLLVFIQDVMVKSEVRAPATIALGRLYLGSNRHMNGVTVIGRLALR